MGRFTQGDVKLSAMEPGMHVLPHTAQTNVRLRLHLGISGLEGAEMRVANETRGWAEGAVIVFDDSFEHEVWHRGTQRRVVLIVDFVSPFLQPAKRLEYMRPPLSKAQRRAVERNGLAPPSATERRRAELQSLKTSALLGLLRAADGIGTQTRTVDISRPFRSNGKHSHTLKSWAVGQGRGSSRRWWTATTRSSERSRRCWRPSLRRPNRSLGTRGERAGGAGRRRRRAGGEASTMSCSFNSVTRVLVHSLDIQQT